MLLYHDGTNSYITNAQGALKIATETSGIALTIGHTTSETTIADNLTVTGDADIDGTTNLDAVDVDGAVQIDGATTVGVDGTGLDVKFFGDTSGSFLLWDQSDDALELTDSSPIKIGDGGDMQVYHDGTNSYITNSQGALKVATETSGIAITIGHTTSEVTIADNLTVTGTLTLGSNAELTEAELEFLDGITAGTAAASKAMVADSNIDITGGRNITISGELDAATLDISGNADIDGTLEADAITINSTAIGSIYGVIAGSSSIVTTGALDSGSITSGFGTIDTGSSTITTTGLISGGSLDIDNVLINGTTIGHTDDTDLITLADGVATVAGELDAATLDISGNADIDGTTNLDAVDIDGAVQIDGAVTVGVDDTGLDVKFFGAAAGAYGLYDQSENAFEVRGATAAGAGLLKLTTGELTVVDADKLGRIDFQSPLESDGTDSVAIAASIWAEADDTFSTSVNNTDLVFALGKSEAAAEKFRFTADTEIGIAGANYGSDGQVLTSGGAGAAVAWETPSSGVSLSGTTNNTIATVTGSNALIGEANLTFDGTNLLVASTGKLYLNDAGGEHISGSGSVLSIAGGAEIDLTATAIDINGTCDVSGVATFSGANVTQQAITSSSNAVAWNAATQPNAYHITTENTTFSAPSNAVEGAFICVEINFNGSHTIGWNTVFEFAASTEPTETATDAKTDLHVFRYNGAIWQEVGRTLNLSES